MPLQCYLDIRELIHWISSETFPCNNLNLHLMKKLVKFFSGLCGENAIRRRKMLDVN